MDTATNIDDKSQDLWETSAGVLDNYNEANVLKCLDEKDHLRTDRHHGFDNNSGDTWIYPTNYPIRKYQHDIVYNALFKNTLVSFINQPVFQPSCDKIIMFTKTAEDMLCLCLGMSVMIVTVYAFETLI